MQEQWAGSRGISKKEMLISADDIPAAEEALDVSDQLHCRVEQSHARNSPRLTH